MEELRKFQNSYEQRFGCCICFSPKLYMVSGQCQHRICEECLYVNDERRSCMRNCPICGLCNSYPQKKPIVPQEVMEIQKCLGVQECPNKCLAQMWYWEVEEHLKCCPISAKQPKTLVKRNRGTYRRRVSDLGPVNTTRRSTRQNVKTYPLRPRMSTS